MGDRMSLRVLVLQHIACEPPGVYEDVLRERGAALHRVEVDAGEPIPDVRAFDAMIAMGGPMGVYEDDRLPWLTEEKRAIRDAVRAGVPFWGVCLGVQLLAASLGARVYAGPGPEVGILPVRLTGAAAGDPVFAALPREFLSLQWHGDTFDLPEGATLLASSPAYPHQAFRWGRAAYGVQFHLEVSAEMAEAWSSVPAYGEALERTMGAGAMPRLLAEFRPQAGAMCGLARSLFERWLDVAAARA